MKKLYFLSLFFVTILSFGQSSLPFEEQFNYTVASNLGGQGNWVNVNSGDEVSVIANNLSYTGLKASAGNSIAFGGAGIDPQLSFTDQTSGVIYSSFLIKVTDLSTLTDAAGGYFYGLAAGSTTFASTVWLKTNGTGFQIGINKGTTIAETQYLPTVYSINTEYFIVISYDLATVKASSIWINPASSSLGEATAPVSTLTTTTGTTDRTNIKTVFIRQDSTTETPSIVLDEVRVGLSWASVTPAATLSVKQNAISGLKVYPNPVVDGKLFIDTQANASKEVNVFDVLGKQVLKTVTTENIVNVANIKSGVYIVKITEEGKTATRKLVIK